MFCEILTELEILRCRHRGKPWAPSQTLFEKHSSLTGDDHGVFFAAFGFTPSVITFSLFKILFILVFKRHFLTQVQGGE